jgi:hypothetical protein
VADALVSHTAVTIRCDLNHGTEGVTVPSYRARFNVTVIVHLKITGDTRVTVGAYGWHCLLAM